MVDVKRDLTTALKRAVAISLPTNGRNVFLFSSPRSGSTWVAELVLSQKNYRVCNEPLDFRRPAIRRMIGASEWSELYALDADEMLRNFFQKICDGRLSTGRFRRTNFRYFTNRCVFKIIHGCEDRISWMKETFGGDIVFLIRHPIAVSISREALPRLRVFLNSDYRRHFTDKQVALAQDIIDNGTHFEQAILHWCFENAVPLKMRRDDWAVITYEQLVVDPQPVVQYLVDKLDLEDTSVIHEQLTKPSGVKHKSNEDTQKLLENLTNDRTPLVTKWRKKATEQQEQRAFEIVDAFDIDVYQFGHNMPRSPYLLG